MPLAYILFLEGTGNRPDQGLPGAPPGVNVPVFPTHPIAPGGPPPGVWPGPGYPAHPVAPGGPPPGVWPGPGTPTPPIYYPPGIWPLPPSGNYPDQGLPVPPGVWPSPGHPAHPIAPGGQPPGIWGGAPGLPGVSHPGLPPGFMVVWSPWFGWIIIRTPTGAPDQGLPGEQPEVSNPIDPGGVPTPV
jgi:hypothetical protein